MIQLKKATQTLAGLMSFLLIVFCASQALSVNVEWELKKDLDLGATPLDVAISLDGKTIFVLVPGEVLLYSPEKDTVMNRIPVDEGFDRIAHSFKENRLILTNGTTNVMRVIQLENVYDITTAGLPYKGPETAPVTIAVFSDYQCPSCARLSGILKEVLAKYPDDVKLVYKNFPLSMHKSAKEAATAALAANEQGKFWEFHDKLFENYKTLNDAKIQAIAQELGLDMEKFEQDMKNKELQSLLVRDVKEAREAGVRGTPTVFIDGKLLKRKTTDGFERMIDSELQKTEKVKKTAKKEE